MLCMPVYDVLENSAVKILAEAKAEVQAFKRSWNEGYRDLERVQELQRRARESVRKHAPVENRNVGNESQPSTLRGYNAMWVCGLSPQTRVLQLA